MSEFTQENWLNALIALYEKATTDDPYRQLCLTDPVAAIEQVSDIELPDDFKPRFHFVEEKTELQYFYALPPKLGAVPPSDVSKELIRWSTYCTDPTLGTH